MEHEKQNTVTTLKRKGGKPSHRMGFQTIPLTSYQANQPSKETKTLQIFQARVHQYFSSYPKQAKSNSLANDNLCAVQPASAVASQMRKHKPKQDFPQEFSSDTWTMAS